MNPRILEAINRGKEKAKEGRSRRESSFFSTPASPDKLIRLFNSEFSKYDYGKALPLAKTTRGMVYGFIKLGRSNGWEEKEFYDIIKGVVEHWQTLKRKDIRSLNGKKVLLGDRPSLLEFLIARDSIISALQEIRKEENKQDVSVEEIKTKVQVFGPTEEDMQAEMENQMEEYLGRG